jgi:hypothetical protein
MESSGIVLQLFEGFSLIEGLAKLNAGSRLLLCWRTNDKRVSSHHPPNLKQGQNRGVRNAVDSHLPYRWAKLSAAGERFDIGAPLAMCRSS